MGLVTESFVADGVQKTFTVSNDILSASHCRVHYYYDAIDNNVNDSDWDLLGLSTLVFIEAPTDGYIVKITTSSDGNGLDAAPSDVSDVAANIDDIVIVADNMDSVVTDATNIADINTVAADIGNVVVNADNIDNINVVAEALESGAGVGGGQFIGSGLVKGIMYLAQESLPNEVMTITSGTNAMSVDSFTVADGSELVIEDGSVYKVV